MELHSCFQYSNPNVYRRGSNGFITEKTIPFQGSRGGPYRHMDPHINTEAVILIETGVWICGHADKTYKHAHLQTGIHAHVQKDRRLET